MKTALLLFILGTANPLFGSFATILLSIAFIVPHFTYQTGVKFHSFGFTLF